MKQKIVPVGDRIVVKRFDADEKSKGGVLIPDSAKEKPRRGEVLAAGTGRVTEQGITLPMLVEKGQVVLFGAYSGHETELDGEKYLILSSEEILAIIS